MHRPAPGAACGPREPPPSRQPCAHRRAHPPPGACCAQPGASRSGCCRRGCAHAGAAGRAAGCAKGGGGDPGRAGCQRGA
eukprot:8704035-Alexandrium_andersonii.AAC.1